MKGDLQEAHDRNEKGLPGHTLTNAVLKVCEVANRHLSVSVRRTTHSLSNCPGLLSRSFDILLAMVKL
eukprot:4205870-Amphidinium_carterae.1